MKDFRPCFKGLFSLLRPVLFKVSGVSLVYLMEAVCSLLFVWYSKRVVDIATGALDEGLTGSVVVLVGIMFFQIIFRVLSKRMEGDICVKAKLSIQKDAFNKAMRSAWNGKDKFHSADVVNRLEEDIRVVSEFLCVTLPSAVVTVFQLVASCALLFSFSSDLAMILIWIMPVAIVASRLYFKKLRSLSLEIRTLDGRIQGYIQEHLQRRILIKTLGAEHQVDSKLERLQDEQIKKTRSRLNYSAVSRFFMQAGFSVGYLTAFLWGVYGLKDGSVSYGLMVAFLQLVGQVQRPVAALASYVPAFIRALSSQERLMDIDEMVGEDTSESKVLPGILSISVRNLNFSYEDGTSVFRDFSCDFAAGELTAICGETGKGKSTLAGILLGVLCDAHTLLDPTVLKLLVLGILALLISGIGGILGGYLMYFFKRGNFNPVIGIAAVSCVPTTAKVAQKIVAHDNPSSMILPDALGANIMGVITSAIIAAIYVTVVPML